MSLLLRLLFLFILAPTLAQAADAKAKPATPPAAPTSVLLDTVTFVVHTEGESHKLVVITGADALRIDEMDDGYSVIYQPKTEFYTGLEHRNYTYWEFSWPEVRNAVQASKRYETHLQDLGNQGVTDSYAQTPTTNDATTSAAPSASDNSGYVWKQAPEHKTISDLDCVRWTGDSLSGLSVEAWCYNGPLVKVQAAMERLRTINEPMSLVPLRTIVPPYVFTVYDALVKGGVTPVQINWGSDQDRNHFTFIEAKTREGKSSLFTVPKLYMKTTLVSMDGLIEQNK